MYGYVICEYEKVRENFANFRGMMANLESNLISHARTKWGDKKVTFQPTGGDIGKTTVIPGLFYGFLGLSGGGPRLSTWEAKYTSTGNNIIMSGGATGNTIAEDYMVGLTGLAFLDKVLRVTEIKMQIGDKKIPRINLEEAMVYNKPAVIFDEGFILDEQENFELYGYVESLGFQNLKLIGLQLNRIPNKLQVTNTGAALT